jgi:hypothetical protein
MSSSIFTMEQISNFKQRPIVLKTTISYIGIVQRAATCLVMLCIVCVGRMGVWANRIVSVVNIAQYKQELNTDHIQYDLDENNQLFLYASGMNPALCSDFGQYIL